MTHSVTYAEDPKPEVRRSPLRRIAKFGGLTLLGLIAFLLVAVFLFSALFPLFYRDYYSSARKEFLIPGLSDGLVSQGFTEVPEEGLLLQCGYMADGESGSRIYLMEERETGDRVELGEVRYVTLENTDGTPFLGHTGGLAVWNDYVYLANDGEGNENGVYVLSLTELLTAPNGTSVTLRSFFQTETRAAYCTVSDGLFFIGEFYKDPEYLTKESHGVRVSDGSTQNALICAYSLDEEMAYGVDLSAPVLALSVRSLVQGFARTEDGKFLLSTSYGLASSHLYLYENVLAGEANGSITLEGSEVPLYLLDESRLKQTLTLPPMSEEPIYRKGRVYILGESASDKYLFGRFIRGNYVYSYPIS